MEYTVVPMDARTRRWLRPLLGVLLALGLGAPALRAQAGYMTAIVFDDLGEPLQGATLLAENPSASPRTLTTISDDRGRLSLIGLKTGQWNFTVEYPGFQPSQFSLPISQATRAPRPVLIRLERIPSIVLGGPLAGVDIDRLRDELADADQAMADGNLVQAVDRYRRALERAPGLPVINLQLAAAYREQHDDARAIAAYEALLEAEPDNPAGLYQLGEMRQAQGRLDEASALYRRASLVEPAWAKPVMALALLAREQGDTATATAQLRRVLTVDPQSPEAVRAQALLRTAR